MVPNKPSESNMAFMLPQISTFTSLNSMLLLLKFCLNGCPPVGPPISSLVVMQYFFYQATWPLDRPAMVWETTPTAPTTPACQVRVGHVALDFRKRKTCFKQSICPEDEQTIFWAASLSKQSVIQMSPNFLFPSIPCHTLQSPPPHRVHLQQCYYFILF